MNKTFVFGGLVLLCTAAPALAQTGNDARSGGHYSLNILGLNNCAGDDLVGSNRHTIQVLLNYHPDANATLDKTNKIYLSAGEFQVLDGNACDGDGAKFQLPPNPFTGEDTEPTFQNYAVWVRALGKPDGKATITSCGIDSDDQVVCSSDNVVLVRDTGRDATRFENKTKELTTIYADLDGDLRLERIGIFDDQFQDYFWNYDNSGLRLAQLRFYPIAD
jgi:hypothetical protein